MYINTRALPRAQLIDRAVIVSSGEAAWEAIHAPDFDPSSTVVVQGGEALPDAAGAGPRSLSFWHVSTNRVELNVQTPSPTYLILSDVFYPGWTATIDDQPADVLPANFAFRAVRVPAGSHRVRMRFEPASWSWGLIISSITGAGLLVWIGLRWRRPVLAP